MDFNWFVSEKEFVDIWKYNSSKSSLRGEQLKIKIKSNPRHMEKENLSAILKNYAPKDCFNANETRLYYSALPTKNFDFNNKKHRITI